tara:strand:- start:351 stop:575 length:225 start_codon:yes stop_codon:yes gene_type:complete
MNIVFNKTREDIIKELEYYDENKQTILKLKRSYRYFKKNNNLEKFNAKYPDGLKRLQEINYIVPTIRLNTKRLI